MMPEAFQQCGLVRQAGQWNPRTPSRCTRRWLRSSKKPSRRSCHMAKPPTTKTPSAIRAAKGNSRVIVAVAGRSASQLNHPMIRPLRSFRGWISRPSANPSGSNVSPSRPEARSSNRMKLRVHRRKLGRYRLQCLNRAAQRLAMFGGEVIVGLPRQHEAEHGADDRCNHNKDGERADDAQDGLLATHHAPRRLRALARRNDFAGPPSAVGRGLFTKTHRMLRLQRTEHELLGCRVNARW